MGYCGGCGKYYSPSHVLSLSPHSHHRPTICGSKIYPSLFSHPRFDLGEAIGAAEAIFDAVASRLKMDEFSKNKDLKDKTKEFNGRLEKLRKRVTISASSAKMQLVKLGNLYSTHTALDLEAVVQGHFQLQWERVSTGVEVEKGVAAVKLKKAELKANDQAGIVAVEDGGASLGHPFDIGVHGTSS